MAVQTLLRLLPSSLKSRLTGSLHYNLATTSDDAPKLQELFASVDWLQVLLEDRIRKLTLSNRTVPCLRHSGSLRTWLMEERSPWNSVLTQTIPMPGMISEEEARYYEYVGFLYEGRGELIELGPWLGKSTRHIINGLKINSNFQNKKLHVFDDFIWRTAWMDRHAVEKLVNHANFQPLFEKYTSGISDRLLVTRAKIADHDGNEALPQIHWNGDPVEIMYIDCGRTLQVNQAWFDIFSPSLIPNVSLLIMQDWRTHRERPRRSYNETLLFTNAHPELELVHEVQTGGIATFLYRG